MTLITVNSWPRAIMHIDCDAFFASVEQAIHPELKNKPVITGAERGIVAAASYEAKRMGIKRGVPLSEATRICPECILMPSDYETYSLFSQRMFAILRRFTPDIEEYSIDEAFADLTGLRRLHKGSYLDIASKIQKTVHEELDITVSIGVSLSKSLAKLCSKLKKPQGLVAIPGKRIHALLEKTSLDTVWGLGPNTVALLKKRGIKNALDFVMRPIGFAQRELGKIGAEIWMELRGESVYKINAEEKKSYSTITKSKTFVPPSSDRNFVLAQAIRNLESACIKARRYKLSPKSVSLYLRQQDFQSFGVEMKLSRASSSPLDLAKPLKDAFETVFQPGTPYRATAIVLSKLVTNENPQLDLFDDPVRVENMEKIFEAVDEINSRYGKHTVFISDGTLLKKKGDHPRNRVAQRKYDLLPGENFRQRLNLPMLAYRSA